MLSAITFSFTAAKLLQVRLGFGAFQRSRMLSRAIGSIMLPHEVRSMIFYIIDPTRRFPVTPKDEPPMTMREILRVGRGTMVLVIVLSLGLAFVNPVGLYYNVLWLLPFYASPFVIHRYCGPGSRAKVMANGGTRDLLSDRRLRTSLDLHRNRWR